MADSISTKCCKDSTIIFQTSNCSIIQYPTWLQVKLVTSPYGNDASNCSNTKVQNEKIQLKCRKSRKRPRHKLNKGEELQLEYHLRIRIFLISCYETLLEVAKKMNYYPLTQSRHTIPVKQTTSMIDLATLCNIDNMTNFPVDDNLECLRLTASTTDVNNIIGRMVYNTEQHDICIKCWDKLFLIPSNTSFLLSDISKIHLLAHNQNKQSLLYNLIVIDPPWENRSAIRGKKYQWLDNNDILQLPITQLSSDHCLVAIWVTNKQTLIEWVKHTLFASWNIQFICEWYWLKVTVDGKFVFDLDSPHKKPYEVLLIGQSSSCDYVSLSLQPEYSTQQPICKKLCYVKEDLLTNIPLDAPSSVTTAPLDAPLSVTLDAPLSVTTVPLDAPLSVTTVPLDAPLSVTTAPLDAPLSVTTVPSRHHSFMCTPSTIHSQKPYIGDLLKHHINEPLRGLELFARNLTPGWTSWGNEVLKFQVVPK